MRACLGPPEFHGGRDPTGVRWGLEQFAMHGSTGLRAESVPNTSSERGANTSRVSNPESEITQESGVERMWKGSDFGNTDMTENLSNLEANLGGTTSSPNMKTTFDNLTAFALHGHTHVASSTVTHVQVTEEVSDLRSTESNEDDHWSTPRRKQGEGHRANRHGRSRALFREEASDLRSTGSNEGDRWPTTAVTQGEDHISNRLGQSRAQVTEEASDLRSTGSNEGEQRSTTAVKQGEGHYSIRQGRSRAFRFGAVRDN